MNKTHNIVFAILVVGLSACASVTSTDAVRKPAEQRAGFMGLSVADETKVQREGPFKGVQRVSIASFKVSFVHGKIEASHAGGGLTHRGGNAAAGLKLTGVSEAVMQELTDAAYTDFVQRLTQAGYHVIDRAELKAQPDFAKVKSETSPQRKSASLFGDKTEIATFAPSSHGDMYWFESESEKSGGFGFANATTAAMAQYGKTGIKVLSVNYVIDFAGGSGYGGRFARRARVEVGQALTLAPDGGVTILGGEGRSISGHSSWIRFGQPLHADEPFGNMVQTTSNTAKGVETALNVLGAFAGYGTSTRTRRDFEVQADPKRYQDLSGKLLTQANDKLITRMTSLR